MTHASLSSRQCIQWIWKANAEPWSSSSEPTEWRSYSDIETAIIEEAFKNKLPGVLLDDYYVNLKQFVQISNINENSQRPIKRIVKEREEGRLREERFLSQPVLSLELCTNAVLTSQRFFVPLDNTFDLDTENETARRILVNKAAEGIIIEGKMIGKRREAEWIAEQLLKVREGTESQVWQCCVRLYSMESFLYKKMNEYMRLVGDTKHEALWRGKVPTYGPFAYLLFSTRHDYSGGLRTVYRGTNLPSDLIEQYQKNCIHFSRSYTYDDLFGFRINFPAFTSTSENRAKAEAFGNVLFVIEISSSDGVNISSYSDYDEEEILLDPTFVFWITSCTHDDTKNKWIIHLHSGAVKHPLII
ncbi:unnamed protein product [Rotaria magnacalcarata]|uniref:NAD(P)(+)--arginine ADP-ribosyltransferase n=1 Tax=Rotaria magnacalcarata TaxID=392030 RepID=A0A815NK90_9BILA|nr:unnamed protein product [Rotaria magnacalcarata]CAF1439000.1 unnamed protein product [Rotaria magnacalcarata]CAF2164033.1 unnamed protein product [Rotaria magnacalcarata]CAF3977142.1 unnamed protein product [Rotaria magnacalcarata]CAF4116010.1 unnamed protein product [Rotaria magnacalcarata]